MLCCTTQVLSAHSFLHTPVAYSGRADNIMQKEMLWRSATQDLVEYFFNGVGYGLLGTV